MPKSQKTKKTIRWGILGLGRIAHLFVKDLLLVEDASVSAVASSNQERADAFAEQYGATKSHGTYEALFEDPDVDIIYVASPHASHAEHSVKALQHKKAVLCEKPIALNHHQAASMVQAAQENKVFFMEAFWSRFNPPIADVIRRVQQGEIGEVRYIQADFSFRIDATPQDRMLNPAQGGGSLLELGVYPMFLAYVLLGKPGEITARAMMHECGVDLQTAMIFDYPRAQALLYSSYTSQSNMTAVISGTEGRYVLNPIWHETDSYAHYKNYSDSGMHVQMRLKGKGFYYEIQECHRCLREGVVESSLWSHTHSLDLIRIADDVRAKIGLRFPQEYL